MSIESKMYSLYNHLSVKVKLVLFLVLVFSSTGHSQVSDKTNISDRVQVLLKDNEEHYQLGTHSIIVQRLKLPMDKTGSI